MAKINWQDIGELTAVDTESVKKAIVIPAKEALRQTRFALGGNLTLRDNMYAAIVTLGYTGNSTQTLTHGTEYTFQNPLKTTPVGFEPIKCFDSNGVALPIPQCTFNTGRTDGLLGITPYFQPPQSGSGSQGEIIGPISRLRSAGTGLTTGVSINLCSTTSITVGPGTWNIIGSVGFLGAAATVYGTFRGCVSLTSATLPSGDTIALPTNGQYRGEMTPNNGTAPGTSDNVVAFNYPFTTASSVVLYLVANATFGGGTLTAYGTLQAVRAFPYLTGYTANVTGILWGG